MVRFRIRYQKIGTIRYASHRDLLRIFRRALAAGEVPACYSQGFNPHPRLSFGPSLRTGWNGLDEYMDIWLERPIDDLGARCNGALPEGLSVVESCQVSDAVPKLSSDVVAARYAVTIDTECLGRRQTGAVVTEPPDSEGTWDSQSIEDDLRKRFPVHDQNHDSEPSLIDIRITAGDAGLQVDYLSTMHQGKSVFPEMLEPYIDDTVGADAPVQVARTALFVERAGSYHSPISKGVVQNLL